FPSWGRLQPMQATDYRPQEPGPKKNQSEPQHTFGRQNAKSLKNVPAQGDTLKVPFDTVYLFDRPLIITAEALVAPAAPPWEVTHRFANPRQPLTAFGACQNDPQSLLWRFLETVTTGDRSYNPQLAPSSSFKINGAGLPAVLVPGKININT